MPSVVQLRGGHLEAVHPFSAVTVRDGEIVGSMGEDWTTTWRSAAKPFQLWCSLEALGDPDDLSDRQLAVGAASHAGQPEHVALVRSVLRRFGVKESELSCGAHPPINDGAAAALYRSGGEVAPIHNNCSGKHAFMLAACHLQALPGDYRDPGHPLQERIESRIAAWAGARPEHGVDGCGVPTWVLPISAMARAWAAVAESFTSGDERLARVARAMMNHPHLTSGTGRLDEELMAGRREGMVVKIGAQALFCMAFPDRRLGLVVKVHTGQSKVLGAAVEAALDHLAPGAWERPPDWPWCRVENVAGRLVGGLFVEV